MYKVLYKYLEIFPIYFESQLIFANDFFLKYIYALSNELFQLLN